MTTQQPEALRLAEILEGDYCPDWFYEQGVDEVSAELRRQHARITELESQLAQRFDAADMATAAAQGFRDGVASVSPVSEPVAWMARLPSGSEVFARTRDFYPDAAPVYTHHSPPEGMAGWMDIETAPQDGRTLLLGYFDIAGKWRTIRGEWLSQDHIYEYAEDPDCMSPGWHETTVEDDDGKCWPIDPTHWMPLPAAPGPAAGQEPVARVNDDGFIVETGLLLSPGMKLYAAPQPAVAAGRMPIETAPKDGSRILLHPAVEVADDWSKGHWNSEHECWIVGGSPSGVVHTAWHPLPCSIY